MNKPYSYKELSKPSFIGKFLNKRKKQDAIIELNNLLASKPIREIHSVDVLSISEKYKTSFSNEFTQELIEFYELFFKECIKDHFVSDEEVKDLTHLKNLLGLSDSQVKEIHDNLSKEIYETNYEEAIKDGSIDEAERNFLKNVKNNILLSDEVANKITEDSRKKYIQSQFDNIISDEKVSPQEWEQLNQIAKNLGIDISIDENVKERIAKYRLFWFIENEPLPIQEVNLNLQKNEVCYYNTACDWHEHRTRTQRINYSGLTSRIRIMKGLYYNLGSITPQKVSTEELTHIDSGTAYITNKRLIFMGSKKNTTIKLDKILSFTPYLDGVGIEKDSGKSPILGINNNADIFLRVLGRAINEY